MFNKFRLKRYIGKTVKKDLSILFSELNKIRNKSDIIAICPSPTGANWLGIMNATISLFPENTFVIPQYYSSAIYNDSELYQLSERILSLDFKMVIFSGFPNYFELLANYISSTKKAAIFHGALSEIKNENNQLKLILDLSESGRIDRLGFIKKGLSEYFNDKYNVKCFELPLKTILPINVLRQPKNDKISIGVFGNSNFNKNIHNQVAAALLVENAYIHIICDDDFSYLKNNNRIVVHSKLERNEFLSLLGQMNINLHISFSESWGQIVTESLALGVPCLTSNNNGIFDYDDFLAENLIVGEYDNPIAIAKQIETVLFNSEEFCTRGKFYIEKLNAIAIEKLNCFIES